MQHIVSYSTGLSSALTVERVLERYGPDHTHIVFMDTLIEDEDNYRFMADCQQRWPVTIEVLTEGRTPYQVAEDQNLIPNQKVGPCTDRLKINIFRDWLRTLTGPLTVHIGYDFSEMHRCEATRRAYGRRGWAVDFPLLWRPVEHRPYTEVCRDDWGIEPPRMYALGYTHANCGGVCVKQGMGDWLRTLTHFPERYAAIEAWEREMRQHPVRQNYALLRDQGNGTVTPVTLEEFRLKHERADERQPALFDFSAPCVQCGVGDFVNGEADAEANQTGDHSETHRGR